MSDDPFAALAPALPDDFSRTLLGSAIETLGSNNALRAHHFASTVRELVTHVLHTLAPDDQMTEASWYQQEPGTDRPTRRQRATYAVQGGMPDAAVDALGIDRAEMQAELRDAFDALNKYTHVREGTLLTSQEDIDAFTAQTKEAVVAFFSTVDDLRAALARTAIRELGTDIFEKFIETSIDDLDILSGQTRVEGIDVDQVEIASIGLGSIYYRIEGTVYVELNWGKGDDGASMNDSYPFTCEVEGSVERIKEFSDVMNLQVDTSSWYGVGEELEGENDDGHK
jgi:hypothetical protein